MAPWRPGRVNKYPVIVAHKVRALLDYQNLDLQMRSRIRARRHTHGLSLSPANPDDEAACKWIDGQAQRRGIVKWTRSGWVKEKPKTGME